MKLLFYIPKNLLLAALLSSSLYAQFDSLIFSRGFTLDYTKRNIHALGDQNSDGYDDFMIYDCAEQKARIFFGGNPVDTLPEFSLNGNFISFSILDLNNDFVNDIVLITRETPGKKIQVHFGGVFIDTIPNISFNPPTGVNELNFGWTTHILKDFNGDGRNELVIFDPFLSNSNIPFGCHYFYNTGSVFDTIPAIVICGDAVDSIRYFNISSSGDLNGDGKTDFTFRGYVGNFNNPDNYFRRFYLGNEEWDLMPDAIYFDDEHSFYTDPMQIIKDINKDSKDDIIINDYGFYPYYYYNAVLKGNFPIDTIPDWGLNTQNLGISTLGTISLGDVNGDGFNDFMSNTFGIYQHLKLWVGGDSLHEVSDKTWFQGEEGFGENYAAVGDVNGDGVDDIAIAAIPLPGMGECKSGRVYIFNGDTSVHGITSVNDIDLIPLSNFKLYDPYPNPFNPGTVISYRLSVIGNVRITIYDILGKQVATLVDEEMPSGDHQIEFDASKYLLSSGVYFIQMKTEDFVSTKKMILLR